MLMHVREIRNCPNVIVMQSASKMALAIVYYVTMNKIFAEKEHLINRDFISNHPTMEEIVEIFQNGIRENLSKNWSDIMKNIRY